MEFGPLHTGRLNLIPFTEQIADVLFDGLQHEQLYYFIADRPPATRQLLRERYTRLAQAVSPDASQQWLNWALQLRSSRDYIGYVQATVGAQTAQVAYMLFRPAWGHGYASEALQVVISLLQAAAIPEVVATVHTDNARSISVLRRAGFHHTKTTTDAEIIHGKPTSEFEFRLYLK